MNATPMTKLLQMHTKALSFLWEGSEDDAVETLLRCLVYARNLFDQISPSSSESGDRSSLSATEISVAEVISAEEDYNKTASSNNCFSLYRFVYMIEMEEECSCDRLTLRKISSFVSFNLAMIYHEMGLINGDLSCLAKARSLYIMSLGLIQQNRVDSQGCATQGECVSEVVLHNNLGHLYSFFGDSNGIESSREKLEASLVASRSLDEKVSEFFYNSLAMARSHAVRLAPAA